MTQYDLLFLLNKVGLIKPAASQEPPVPGRNWLEPPAPQEFWLLRWALWALGNWHRRLDSWVDTPVATNRGTVLGLVSLTVLTFISFTDQWWAESRNMDRHLTKLEWEKTDFCHWIAAPSSSFRDELQEQMSRSDYDIFQGSRFVALIHEHCRKK